MEENTNKIDFSDLSAEVAEKTSAKLVKLYEKTSKKNENTGFKKIKKKIADPEFKIRWICGACNAYIDEFQGEEGVKKMKDYLKKFWHKEYKPCPKQGKKHICSFDIGKSSIIFKTELVLSDDNKPIDK